MNRIKPMLARSGTPFNDPQWIFEVKWDGTRALCVVNETVQFFNRREMDITYRYPELQAIRENIKASCIVDGEIVVLKEGKPSFQNLQRREHTDNPFRIRMLSKQIPAVYIVFDILFVDGKDVTKKELSHRKSLLKRTVSESSRVMVSPYIEGKGKEYFTAVTEAGFEGVMAKRKDSLYYPGERSEAWLKIKKTKTLDCVIGGFTEGEGQRAPYFGALLLGVGQPLTFVGKVGTGFSHEGLTHIYEMLKKRETDTNPFAEKISVKAHFVEPVYVCEVKYLELTPDKKLRAPIFLRLRPDKDPEECTLTGFNYE
ncbi:MAG: DNA ligase [Theionarchaea archaeon]|nr:DNA ligase [Theionarchaea archaeon]